MSRNTVIKAEREVISGKEPSVRERAKGRWRRSAEANSPA